MAFNNESIGIIGGADGPTAILVSGNFVYVGIFVAVVVIVATAVILHKIFSGKK